jgi:hypothetical protein
MVEQLATNPQKFAKRTRAVFALGGLSSPAAGVAAALGADPITNDEPVPPVASETTTTEVQSMTAQELAAKFVAENPEAAALIRAEGATAELARVQAVRAQALPGHEALIEKLAADGKTPGPAAAAAVVAAERGKAQAADTARAADAVPPVAAAENPRDDAAPESGEAAKASLLGNPEALDKAARAYMAANPGTDYLSAVKAVAKE